MNTLRLLLLTGACCLLVSGCRVSSHENGDKQNVEIGTPFGSMHVRTNGDAPVVGIGIAVYPGATLAKDHDDDTNSADVNMNFGDFHLGVRAASYRTADSPDQVLSFYKKDLAHYGDVLECRDNKPVGQPARTSQGLTCTDDGGHHNNVHLDNVHVGSDLELRTGSPQHQHIVAIDRKDGGTKIGLVALDLPEHHDSGDSE
ncbi:MAG TPA: hypothetical protein VIJ65_11610 [Acidobacteriaceae bacterium]